MCKALCENLKSLLQSDLITVGSVFGIFFPANWKSFNSVRYLLSSSIGFSFYAVNKRCFILSNSMILMNIYVIISKEVWTREYGTVVFSCFTNSIAHLDEVSFSFMLYMFI